MPEAVYVAARFLRGALADELERGVPAPLRAVLLGIVFELDGVSSSSDPIQVHVLVVRAETLLYVLRVLSNEVSPGEQ
jgi:hypothetical protein